jgi:hypothetical protein
VLGKRRLRGVRQAVTALAIGRGTCEEDEFDEIILAPKDRFEAARRKFGSTAKGMDLYRKICQVVAINFRPFTEPAPEDKYDFYWRQGLDLHKEWRDRRSAR